MPKSEALLSTSNVCIYQPATSSPTTNKCVPFLVTNMTEPRVFVIHNDRDFQRVLADPLTFHAHYLLVGLGINNDAILDQYPNVGTASWVKLVHTFKFPTGDFCDGYRLFHVVGHPTQSP